MSDTPDEEPAGPFTYRFTNAYPALITGLSYGPDVHVQHEAVDGEEPLPEAPVEGATVILYPGDVVTVPFEIVTASLERTDAPAAAPEQPPVTPPTTPEPPASTQEPEAPADPAPPADEPPSADDGAPETPTTDQTEQ